MLGIWKGSSASVAVWEVYSSESNNTSTILLTTDNNAY